MDREAREFTWNQVFLLREHVSSLEARGAMLLTTQIVGIIALLASSESGRLSHGAPHILAGVALIPLAVGLMSTGEMVLPARGRFTGSSDNDDHGPRARPSMDSVFRSSVRPTVEVRTTRMRGSSRSSSLSGITSTTSTWECASLF